MKEKTTWRRAIALTADGDVIVRCTLTESELDRSFDPGLGGTSGIPFTAWSESYVYFPACYDGAEWVERVPRDPCDIRTNHVGG